MYVEIKVTRLEIYVDKSKFICLVELEETDHSMDSNSNLEHINNTWYVVIPSCTYRYRLTLTQITHKVTNELHFRSTQVRNTSIEQT